MWSSCDRSPHRTSHGRGSSRGGESSSGGRSSSGQRWSHGGESSSGRGSSHSSGTAGENYYTSPGVYLKLYENGINCCGTVLANRWGFPKELIKAKQDKLDRKYYDYLSNGPLVAAIWYNQHNIHFLSTTHIGASRGDTVKWWNPDGRSVYVSCIPLLSDYQQCMHRVDRGDQPVGYHNILNVNYRTKTNRRKQ